MCIKQTKNYIRNDTDPDPLVKGRHIKKFFLVEPLRK